jgi:serine/threonine protein kinase
MPAPIALTSGAKLGPYEILSPLGAGDMGEVYRARDTRLDPTVAVKIPPADFLPTQRPNSDSSAWRGPFS